MVNEKIILSGDVMPLIFSQLQKISLIHGLKFADER
jgi:hypothetical protein